MGTYRMVTFDGGGILGAIGARFLKRITEARPTLLDGVACYAGTSVGSLMGSLLALGLSPTEVMLMFQPPLIAGTLLPYPAGPGETRGEDVPYHIDPATIVQKILGVDIPLSKVKCGIFLPCFDLGQSTGAWAPLFQSNLPGSTTADVSIVDAVLRSTACPVYWPTYQNCTDGWVCANNPCLAAISAVLDRRYSSRSRDEMRVISFGVGRVLSTLSGDRLVWGQQQWQGQSRAQSTIVGSPLMDILFTNQSLVPAILSEQLLGANRFLRVDLDLLAPVPFDDPDRIPFLIDQVDAVDIQPYLSWIDANWS